MKNKDMTNRLIVTSFTDPICTWCWGTEPILRKLQTHYPDVIEFRYMMGGLVEDIHLHYDSKNNIGGGSASDINKQIVAHWHEASQRHKMPVAAQGLTVFSEEYTSSYPQNIAYKAAQAMDPIKADVFLRRIREAAATETAITAKTETLLALAQEVGLDTNELKMRMEDGTAERSFKADLAINQTLGVTGFPTTELKYNNGKFLLRGYHSFDTFVEVITKVTNGALHPIEPIKTDEALYALMEYTPHLAAEEVRQAFDIKDSAEVETWMARLIEEGQLVKREVGDSFFVRRAD